ncbi:MAG: MOSC domain-containing protein [Mucilaginibacter sp.]
MLTISELYIYPIKSLGGIKITSGEITDRGFQYDRRWMLVDKNNYFLSQRVNAQMALFDVTVTSNGLKVFNRTTLDEISIPFEPQTEEFAEVTVWDDTCTGQIVSNDADKWFSKNLSMSCRLVYMPVDTERFTNPKYTPADSLTSFADAYPFMMIGHASLDDLNTRLSHKLPINRFRPNIVFTGGLPYQEDRMDSLTINNIVFRGVKLCARCNMITIDQGNAAKSKEPTKTLATFRRRNNDVYFGQNLISEGTGVISVGDELTVLTTHTAERFII